MTNSSDQILTRDDQSADDAGSLDGRTSALAADRWWPTRIATAVALPAIAYLVLRPERFGLTPNRLDPFFYTGYAINFDDIMGSIGDSHYFVSRWPAYLPSRLATEILGPDLGRLVLRWLAATAVLLCLWHVGRQWRWTRPAEVVIGTVTITTPMFVRSLMTDYIEWLAVVGLLLLTMQCLEPDRRWYRSIGLGVLVAVVAIVNPIALTASIAPLAIYLVRTSRPAGSVRSDLALIAGAATGVVIAGLLLFRWRYGIANVYAPTIEFMRERPASKDPWRSPRSEWMLAYSWIYIPPLALAVGWIPAPTRRRLRASDGATALSVSLGGLYLFQWADHVLREGNGIEISYYWVFILPATVMYLAHLAGLHDWRWSHAATFLTAWVAVLIVGRYSWADIPQGLALPFVLVIAAVALVALGGRRAAYGSAALLLTTLVLQVNAPHYDPSSYYEINSDPRYDDIFFNSNSVAVEAFDDSIWLESTLDRVPGDVDLYFLATEDYPLAVTGIYGPHVTGRVLRAAGAELEPSARQAIELGFVDQIAVYGSPDVVSTWLEELEPVTGTRVLDEWHAGGLRTRVVVIGVANPRSEPFEWTAEDLFAQTGVVDDDGNRLASEDADSPGFLVFGPYVPLTDRSYRVELVYRGGEPGETVGTFDVAPSTLDRRTQLASVASVPVVGSGAARSTIAAEFVGSPDRLWEFRVQWFGAGELSVEKISIEPLS